MWLLWLALLAQSPDLMEQGVQALDTKQYDRAVELFTQAAGANPKDYAAEFQLGLAYSLLGKDADAVPHYKAALDLKPDLYQGQLNLGLSLLRMKDPRAAQPYLESALEQKSSATAESALGRAIARQGNPAAAEPHFRKAVAMDPSRRDDLLELAQLYEAAHQPTQAIAIYREFPDRSGAQERLSALLADSGHPSEAIEALEAAVATTPTEQNRMALAEAYVRAQQLAKAEPIVALLVGLEPRDRQTRLFYGRILRDEKKLAEAATQFGILTDIRADSVEGWSELASVLMVMEQFPRALDALDHVRALGAENAGHVFFRALALDHLNRKPEAIESYNRFLAMNQGKFATQEFQARQRVRILENERRSKRRRYPG
jgi:tetratricopeptide (TPR) repeat protein